MLVQERQPERCGVAIVEVSPRDGLQNESVLIPTEKKIGLIRRAIALGARRIEVASFVHPDRVPQMADAEAVIEALPDEADVVYIGLVLNKRGALRALATKVHELGAVCVATDRFAQRNQGQTARESLDAACEIVRLARDAGRSAQITIGASFGCPFEGEVSAAHVVDMAKRAADAQPREIAIADTIGVGVPAKVADLIGALREAVYPLPIRGHFHNTRGSGVANVWAAVQAGAQVIDASLGGIGGCPFAPSAAGNVATEDVAYLFERSGISTGIDLGKAIESVAWLSEIMGRRLPGTVSRAGGFPSAA